jgi:hypothetical protein
MEFFKSKQFWNWNISELDFFQIWIFCFNIFKFVHFLNLNYFEMFVKKELVVFM